MIKKLIKIFKPKPKISILSLNGIIGKVGIGRNGMCLSSLNSLIEEVFAKPKTRAVILSINSPGGSPVQSELISSRIRQLSREKSIPVYSFIEDVGASGGYWLACTGEEIYASRSSVIGSIGVVSSGFGLKDAIKKLGIERRIITQGKNKSVLDPFSDVKKSDIEIINNIQKSIHSHFIDLVKTSRKDKLNAKDEVIFNGEFWAGEKALELGLIDGIDNIYDFIKNKFGDKVKIDYIKSKESWFKRKFLSSISSEEIVDTVASRLEEEALYSKLYIR